MLSQGFQIVYKNFFSTQSPLGNPKGKKRNVGFIKLNVMSARRHTYIIGQPRRAIKTRLKEHKANFKTNAKKKSRVDEIFNTGHIITAENFKPISTITNNRYLNPGKLFNTHRKKNY